MKHAVWAWVWVGMAMAVGAQAQGGKDRRDILVTVENGRTTVREERAHTSRDEVAIVWRAPAGYRFADDGIVIEGGDDVKFHCGPRENGKRFRCSKKVHNSGDEIKYSVNLVEESSGRALDTLDPVIISD